MLKKRTNRLKAEKHSRSIEFMSVGAQSLAGKVRVLCTLENGQNCSMRGLPKRPGLVFLCITLGAKPRFLGFGSRVSPSLS
ncbi:hypothetical protein GOP47_0006478 [Adiantum capillus-veneris]|uniref:Uncharacterized protein n=1 Tax=Adiantum capillus-veneris TaxID=13818 RepID=A0A9D4V4H1_ADICA|nr:hypothetical protein GOP47_0006478 [Adiantum capillus-veneris]